MKASELIAVLQKCVAEFGDLEVAHYDDYVDGESPGVDFAYDVDVAEVGPMADGGYVLACSGEVDGETEKVFVVV